MAKTKTNEPVEVVEVTETSQLTDYQIDAEAEKELDEIINQDAVVEMLSQLPASKEKRYREEGDLWIPESE